MILRMSQSKHGNAYLIVGALAIHLVRGDVDEAVDFAIFATFFQQHMGPNNIILGKAQGVLEGVVYSVRCEEDM